MSDYARANSGGSTHFGDKDSLSTGDADKVILGVAYDTEFNAIVTAIASKFDSNDLSSQAQAEGLTLDTVLITPHSLNDVLVDNAGILADLQGLSDPGADRILFWDDGAGSAAFLTASTGLSLSGTSLTTNDSAIVHDNLSGFVADEHVAHSGVTLTAGNGLTGGGTIASSRTFNVGAGDGITVNADDVALASSTAGTGLTYTTGVLNVIGGDGITANSNDIEVDSTVVRTTGAQTVGGAKTFSADTVLEGSLTVQDDVVFNGVITNANDGTLNDVAIADSSVIVFTGTGNTVVTGFAGGVDGRILVVINNVSGGSLTMNQLDAGSQAGNRLNTTSSTAVIGAGAAGMFIYNANNNDWSLIGDYA